MTWYRGSMPLAAFVCLLTTLVMVVALDGRNDCVDKSQRCQYVLCRTGWIRKSCPKTCGSCRPKSTTPPFSVRFSSTIKTLRTTHDSTTEKISTSHSPTTLKTASTFSSTMARTSAPTHSTLGLSSSKEALVTTRHGRQTTLQNTDCVDKRRECRYWICKSDTIKRWCPKKCGLCKATTSPTTRIPSTIKTPITDDSTTEKISSKITSEEDPVTTRQDFKTTLQITEPGRTSFVEQRLPDRPTTNQTSSEEFPNAYASYSTTGLNVAMVTGIAGGCLLVLAVVIILFIVRRNKRRGASLMHEPESIITMQPFSQYKRDKPLDNATRIYDELQDNKGASNKQLIDDFEDNEPFYHVLEGCSPHKSFQDQQLYACADFNSHENSAFEMSSQTMPSQPQPEVESYETITLNAADKNKVTKEDQPYYHVLENNDSKIQGTCDGAPLPVYQPLMGVKKDAIGNIVDRRNVYQPLTGVRYKGAKMSS